MKIFIREYFDSTKGRALLLIAGALLLFLTRERWAVHLLAWFGPVPFIILLQSEKKRRQVVVFVLVYCTASMIAAAKSFMPPWPGFMAVVFGLPIAVAHCAGYLLWRHLQRGIPSWLGNLLFASVMTVMEWILWTLTPFGTVSAAANSQVDNLPLLQILSLFGISGLSFLLYWTAAVTADSIQHRRVPYLQTGILVSFIVLAHIWGSWRIGTQQKKPGITVATVQTDFDWFADPVFPSAAKRKKITNTLIARTDRAAQLGAKMIVWNEIANAIDPADEPDIIKRVQKCAKQRSVHIIASYLNLVSRKPLRWENKYVWINPDGDIVDTYLKHKPAIPIEPAVKGTGVPVVAETGFGKAAGAICFDFDFPQIGRALAVAGADFVFVPGADTYSIDPYHTQLAAMRAIEGGYSVIRSARHGSSAGIDNQGRIRGWLSANAHTQKIMLVTIPAKASWTLYKTVGDILAWLAIAFLVTVAVRRIYISRLG